MATFRRVVISIITRCKLEIHPSSSHKLLLEQMSLEIPHTRPPVILSDTLHNLNEYRGFRHVAIHRYGFELESNRIADLTDKLMASYTLLVRDIENFCQFLQALE